MFRDNDNVPYAGAFLALAALALDPYLDCAMARYGQFKAAFYGTRTIFLTLLLMILLRILRIDRFQRFNPTDLGFILGLDRSPEPKTLRRRLSELTSKSQAATLMSDLAQARCKVSVRPNADGNAAGFCVSWLTGTARLPCPLSKTSAKRDAMPTRTQTRRLWEDRINTQVNSGLTAAEFCRQHELSVASFYAWRARLRQTGTEHELTEAFVELPAALNPSIHAPDITVRLPNGISLTLGNGFCELSLRRALSVCQELAG